MMQNLVFLKLGGSLITDKSRANTHLPAVLARLADEITSARRQDPSLRLLLGHGSGSFGHAAASKWASLSGGSDPATWAGFVEVWRAAHTLNRFVLDALAAAGLPAVAFPPSACATSRARRIVAWDPAPVQAALSAGLLPVVNGDVTFDQELGAAIVSTEEAFSYLARFFRPRRILLAGVEEGVWEDFPVNTRLIPVITMRTFSRYSSVLAGSQEPDVTGGMLQKVESMLSLVEEIPGLQAHIFSGRQPGVVRDALLGASPGTCLRSEVEEVSQDAI